MYFRIYIGCFLKTLPGDGIYLNNENNCNKNSLPYWTTNNNKTCKRANFSNTPV